MSLYQQVSPAETEFIRRYFDGIDHAISRELTAGETTYEEFLTATLGRLMDQGSPFQALLEYPLRALNEDLNACGSGNYVIVEFETHEHSKSSARSIRADLGIIIRFEGPLQSKTIEKAVLIEAKRLYPTRDCFNLSSRYEAFKLDQLKALLKVEKKYGRNFVYYFLYNPTLFAFDKQSAEIIRAYENQNENIRKLAYMDPDYIFMLARNGMLPYLSNKTVLGNPEHIRDEQNERADKKPGLRVMSVSSLEGNDVLDASQLRLDYCYSFVRSRNWIHRRFEVPFPSLSEFIVDFVGTCSHGSTRPEALTIASGRDVEPVEPDSDDDGARSVLASHTLRITIASTLGGKQG